jgi:hypothetical protein
MLPTCSPAPHPPCLLAHTCPPHPPPTQIEAETYFISNLIVHPVHFPRYWIGLNSSAATWPSFTWVDGYSAGPSGYTGAYTNWGKDSTGVAEPNNRTHGFCAVADYLEAKNVTSRLTFNWAWNDVDCTTNRPSMCWQPPRECAGHMAAGAPCVAVHLVWCLPPWPALQRPATEQSAAVSAAVATQPCFGGLSWLLAVSAACRCFCEPS